jgi:glyoxylase-like metal-dependent hydrolase (beta-lactamase superfamily II)
MQETLNQNPNFYITKYFIKEVITLSALHVSLDPLDHDIIQIDLMYSGLPRSCAGYLITKPVPVLIETGPKPSVPYILEALKRTDIDPAQLRYIIVTHIHLDHAGGAGTLLQYCPNAKVIIHEKGARHMVDPSKLIAGARHVYGEEFDTLLEGIDPIPTERIYIPKDMETLDLGHGRILTFIDTPGHAYHHLCIYDSQSQGIFCGDAVGLSSPVLSELGTDYVVPSTSPTQFNPQSMTNSINRLAEFKPRILYFTHFGISSNAAQILWSMRELIEKWVIIATEAYPAFRRWQDIEAALWRYHEHDLTAKGVPAGHPAMSSVKDTLALSAKGLAHYLDTVEKVCEEVTVGNRG